MSLRTGTPIPGRTAKLERHVRGACAEVTAVAARSAAAIAATLGDVATFPAASKNKRQLGPFSFVAPSTCLPSTRIAGEP
ncbi:MAG: hypothetical protein IPG04_28730 [Polyangiaceae bacterium]|jgi:hypothetical protein|nr:hypothetical protein [Polyangiaceae bacterium]